MIQHISSAEDFLRAYPVLSPGMLFEELGLSVRYQDSFLFWRTPEGQDMIVVRLALMKSIEWFELFEACTQGLMRRYGVDRLALLDSHCLFFQAEQSDFEVMSQRPVRVDSAPRDHSIHLFREMIAAAVALRATDIHCELKGDQGRVSFRVYGHLSLWQVFSSEALLSALAAAYTIMGQEMSRSDSGFNKRIPQSAILVVSVADQSYHCRFQSHPTVDGLCVVLRLLRMDQTDLFSLQHLGFSQYQQHLMCRVLEKCTGLIVIAGPTGSGKTTTLATLMKCLYDRWPDKKFYAIEDPIEYDLPWVSQISMQRSALETEKDVFLSALKAFLRMDPDVGMIGEIRDYQTAHLVQSAVETGHCILSTVHARSSVDIFSRLSSEQLGMSPALIYEPSFMQLSIYQRLVPLLCPHCSMPALSVLSGQEKARLLVLPYDPEKMRCRCVEGCSSCRPDHTSSAPMAGCSGQTVVAECFVPTEESLLALALGRYHQVYQQHFSEQLVYAPFAWLHHLLLKVSEGLVDPRYYFSFMGYLPRSNR